jgi:AcrR family transcriptional regulator
MAIGHREHKKELTRDALVAEAARLFERRGFDGVTVDEIAVAAGVSRRTFFRYFPSKESVVFPGHERRLEAFRDALAQAGEEASGFEQVRRACRVVATQLGDARDELRAQRRLVDRSPALIAKERELDARWEDAIVAVFAAAEGPLRARMLAATIMGAIRGSLLAWFEAGADADLAELGEEALDLLARGLSERGRPRRVPSTGGRAPATRRAAPRASRTASNRVPRH